MQNIDLLTCSVHSLSFSAFLPFCSFSSTRNMHRRRSRCHAPVFKVSGRRSGSVGLAWACGSLRELIEREPGAMACEGNAPLSTSSLTRERRGRIKLHYLIHLSSQHVEWLTTSATFNPSLAFNNPSSNNENHRCRYSEYETSPTSSPSEVLLL